MSMIIKLISVAIFTFLSLLQSLGSNATDSRLHTCEWYVARDCAGNASLCNATVKTCDPPEYSTKKSHCFAYWHYGSKTDAVGKVIEDRTTLEVVIKGCWLDSEVCYDRKRCSADVFENGNYFCCCEGDLCNMNISTSPNVRVVTPPTTLSLLSRHQANQVNPGDVVRVLDNKTVLYTLLGSLLPLICIAVSIVAAFLIYRVRRQSVYDNLSLLSKDHLLVGGSSSIHSPHAVNSATTQHFDVSRCCSAIEATSIKLLEIKAKGTFSCVWKARRIDDMNQHRELLAVKVLGGQDCMLWSTERDLYALAGMREHENILRFVSAIAFNHQLWIVTEFQENGSLYEHLKANTVGWSEVTSIASGVAQGLSFLHSATRTKPPIAHRDLKTRNILLKGDFSPCIADFGLAIVLNGDQTEAHAKVGTLRYMAPEVLQGCITFGTDCILKMDIYSLSLILYELISRCTAASDHVKEYSMPYEDIVGAHPTMDEMKDAVDTRRIRPPIEQNWLRHKGISVLCVTIEECWDHDPEARLSAECVHCRIEELILQNNDFNIDYNQQQSDVRYTPVDKGVAGNPTADLISAFDLIRSDYSGRMYSGENGDGPNILPQRFWQKIRDQLGCNLSHRRTAYEP